MKIQLTDQELKIVIDILKKILPGEKYFIFGSRAKGKARQYSDLDLAIDMGKPIPLAILASLRQAFDDTDLVFVVDIVDWHRIDASFQQHISDHAMILD